MYVTSGNVMPELIDQRDRACITRAYDDISSCVPPKLQHEIQGRLEQLVMEVKNPGELAIIFVHAAEVTVLEQIFKRKFRGESYQAFTRDGARKCLAESDKLMGFAKTEMQKRVREQYRYEADQLHRIAIKILESFGDEATPQS